MTNKEKKKIFRKVFEIMFDEKYIHQLKPIEFKNQGIKFKPTKGTLRGYTAKIGEKTIVIMEQNKSSFSKSAILAKYGFDCAWIWQQLKPWPNPERKWLAFMIRRLNGDICIYSGNNIMSKVYKHLKDDIDIKRSHRFND